MSTMRLLPDRLVTGDTPARHRSARSSRRCTASKASASSVARTIRPTPGKDRRIVTSHGSGLCPSAPSCAATRLWVRRSSRSSTSSICRFTRSSRLVTASRWLTAALTVPGARGIAGVRSRSSTSAAESRREPPDPVALEQAIHRRFAHPRRLLRGRDQTPKIEEPGRGDVIGQPEYLRVEAPQEFPDAVAEPVALLFQVLRCGSASNWNPLALYA